MSSLISFCFKFEFAALLIVLTTSRFLSWLFGLLLRLMLDTFLPVPLSHLRIAQVVESGPNSAILPEIVNHSLQEWILADSA